jgi:hypothetical protein
MVFLAPKAIGRQVNTALLANQVSRQWWEELVSPATRNHLWLTNGLAAYSEVLWAEHEKGPGAAESQLHNVMVESLTVDNVPVIQSARLEDFSPELWALTGSKGASVLSMLRYVVGDENFFKSLKAYAEQYPWKSVNTDDFRKVVEKVSGQDLGYFFIQWIESSGAPEFKLEYTIYRTQKGFRVMGKIAQDLDTFRMPVNLKITTEGNPEEKRVEVVGTSSEFSVDTFGKPKSVIIDPDNKVLRYSGQVRVAVAIRRGEQFMELSEFGEALKEYQKALPITASPRCISSRTITRTPPTRSAKPSPATWTRNGRKCGATSTWATSSTSAASASALSTSTISLCALRIIRRVRRKRREST